MNGKDTFKYQLKQGGKVVYRGITNDLNRREAEHQKRYPGTRLEQVGGRVTRSVAIKWLHKNQIASSAKLV